MKNILIVYYSQSGNTEALARGIARGVEGEGAQVTLKNVGETTNDDLIKADAIIVGSPVYFGSVTPEVKSLIDRAGYSSRGGDGSLLRRKVCAGVVAVRRQGAGSTLEQINHIFILGEAIVAHSSYWNMAFGKEPGEIVNDDEGVKTLKKLGDNMAWLLKKIHQ